MRREASQTGHLPTPRLGERRRRGSTPASTGNFKRIRLTAVKEGLFIRVVYSINVDGDGECQDSGDVNVQADHAGADACAARQVDH